MKSPLPDTPWHTLSAEQVMAQLETNLAGLSNQEAEKRQALFGKNELPQEDSESWLRIFARQFTSPLLYILIAAGIVAAVAGEYIDAGVIGAVLVFNGFMGAFQEGRAQQALRALKQYTTTEAAAYRQGMLHGLPDIELVPGDIIVLQAGDKVPADARIISSDELQADEASLTGESLPVPKSEETLENASRVLGDRVNMVFKGTFIVTGKATAVVVATGLHTAVGSLAATIADAEPDIPLKKNIASLSRIIILGSLVIIGALFVVGWQFLGYSLTEMLLVSVSLLVSVIPEGLPIVLTLVLALGVNRMAKRNALIKKLQAVETLAHTTVIAVDKTGTITRNELMIERMFVNGRIITVTGQGYIPRGKFLANDIPADSALDVEYAAYLAALSANASLSCSGDECDITGDPTEAALLVLGAKCGFTKPELLAASPLLYEIPFSRETNYYANIHRLDGVPAGIVAGSPESVLELCSSVWHPEGSEVITKERGESLHQEMKTMAESGLRVLALAIQTHTIPEDPDQLVIKDLTFVALFGMSDGLRDHVYESIAEAKRAGMHVVMITGDHAITAGALAASADVFDAARHEVITGLELETLDDKALVQRLDRVTVFARATPEHKLRIIEAFKRRGDIIAMTGDGVNDVPPLIAAHLGLAMGKIGTPVAQEAADIVLLDDNFSTITAAIEEGRHIFNTLKKVFVYLFATNISELLIIVLAITLLMPLPLTAAQIIWLNLVTDTFLVLALAFEPKQKGLLDKPFPKPSRYIIDREGVFKLAIFSAIITAGTLFVFMMFKDTSIELARTMVLATLWLFQLFGIWSMRSDTESMFRGKPWRSPWLIGASLLTILLQAAIIYTPFGQRIFETVPLMGREWGIAIGIAFSIIVVDEIRKSIVRILTK